MKHRDCRAEGAPAPARVEPAQYEHLADFRYALRAFLHFSEAAAHEAGLTPKQHQALLAIKGSERRGGVNIGELSRQLFLRHHSTVELVDRLVAAHLVVRQTDPQDGRRVALRLSGSAEAILERLSEAHLQELGTVGPMLTALLKDVAATSSAES